MLGLIKALGLRKSLLQLGPNAPGKGVWADPVPSAGYNFLMGQLTNGSHSVLSVLNEDGSRSRLQVKVS